MEPKGLPEFPGKSRKSPPRRPGTSQEPPGTPKGPPRHPTAAKRTSKDPKKSPKGPPYDSQKHPRDALRTHKGVQKTPDENTQNDTPKKPKLKMENRCKRHRDSDSTDATLKQHCVDNDLSLAECAERSAAPPGRRARHQSGIPNALVLVSPAILASLYPPIIPPRDPAHSAGREPISTSSGSLFRLQKRIRNFIDFWLIFFMCCKCQHQKFIGPASVLLACHTFQYYDFRVHFLVFFKKIKNINFLQKIKYASILLICGYRTLKIWEKRTYKNLDENTTVNSRNLKLILRRLRKFAREGAEKEFDLENTIDKTAKNAGILDIKYRPEKTNKVRLILFIDVGGSMDEHAKSSQELFSAAKSEFKSLEYF